MTKNVLQLNYIAVRKFFLTQEAYTNIDLPPYFVFNKVLSNIVKIVKNNYLLLNELNQAKQIESVNHILYGNKDGKYAWRKYQIINPLIYVSLVNIITEKNNWNFLQNRFKEFQNDEKIECESISVLPNKKEKQKAAQISWWVTNVEKRSIALSLEYQFLFQTDIEDCYGSIYTHSLPWAIHTKTDSKHMRGFNDLFGNKIDRHIQAMSYGQTNGIPQGSILMDFIAEIVLGYVDLKLSEKLKKDLKGKDFHILRYRDDYRIFVNDVSDGDKILKYLSELLLNLGFRLNTHKTYFSDDVINGSIKKDKIEALKYGVVPKKLSKRELLRQLLIIQTISKNYPNSGTITMRLSNILNVVKLSDFTYQQDIIIGILIDIAYNNPNSFPMVSALASVCISKMSIKKQSEIITKIQNKICTLPNIGLLEIWLQRMVIKLNTKIKSNEKLCKNAYDNKQRLFNTNWIINSKIKTIIDSNSYLIKNRINKIDKIINKKEVQIFKQYNQ